MSFENIKDFELDNGNDRSCVIMINFNNKEQAMLRNISSLMGMKDVVILSEKNSNSVIKDVLDGNISEDYDGVLKNKAIIFNNILHSRINAFLSSLKKVKINQVLTAVVTEDSIQWSVEKLVINLAQERKAINEGKQFNHK